MATLSYAADLGLGQPMAHCMRQTVIALRLAGLLGASDRELEATYYLGLMMNVYCHADRGRAAQWFGDDIGMKGDGFELLDMSTARMVTLMWRRAGSHGSGLARARRLAAFPVAAPTRDIAQRLVVTPKTAANHVEHIYTKLGVSSRAAATLYATQHGLVGTFEPAELAPPDRQ